MYSRNQQYSRVPVTTGHVLNPRRNVKRLARSPRNRFGQNCQNRALTRQPVCETPAVAISVIAKPRAVRPESRVWYPARLPGQPAVQVRATRPHGVPGGEVRKGDRFGRWTVESIRSHTARHHGFRCGCAWGWETPRTDPAVCFPVTKYEFKCCCDCGTVRTVKAGNLLYGRSLSCGCGDLILGAVA